MDTVEIIKRIIAILAFPITGVLFFIGFIVATISEFAKIVGDFFFEDSDDDDERASYGHLC